MGKGKDKKKKINLTMRSMVRTLSLKFYDEQMPDGWGQVKVIIRGIGKEYQVIAIRHDRDTNKDDIWKPSIEKPHYHIIVRVIGKNPVHVSTILNMLNIEYRPDVDETLWNEHGVETVKNFGAMAMYLTHDTEQAQLDGKEKYELEELVSNLSMDEIKQVREGYIRVSASNKKVSMEELSKLDEEAYKMGYDLKDFDEWYRSLPFQIRSNAKMKTIRESYNMGASERAELKENLNRLCVFIEGESNTGKTYATIHALDGKRILPVGGGGTGKFDELSTGHDALVIDDDSSPRLLNMCDNYICQAYRRGRNNPWWCGRYFIVTSNLSFREWVEECGIKTTQYKHGIESESSHYRAIKTRFYVCHIENIGGINQLVCDSSSTRGTSSARIERKEMFKQFRDKFNTIMAEYVPESEAIDDSDILWTGEKASTSSMTEKGEIKPTKSENIDRVQDIADNIIQYLEENDLKYSFSENETGVTITPECDDASEYIYKKLRAEHIWFTIMPETSEEDESSGIVYCILYEEETA